MTLAEVDVSLTMTIRIGPSQLVDKLDLDELEALHVSARGSQRLREAVDLVFEVPEFGEPKVAKCGPFAEAVDTLLREGRAGLCAFVYYVYGTPMPGKIPKGAASGAGVMIGGLRGVVMGGADECTLTKFAPDDSGQWKQVSVQDVRHMKVIRSDDGTELEIRKRSKPGNTIRWLRRMKEGLKGCAADAEVLVTIG